MHIYKIFRRSEWAGLLAEGRTAGAPVDLADGFIHFSTADQLPGTLAKHFAGESGLVLAVLEGDALGPELRWEPARGGEFFPHLYRILRLEDVIFSQNLRDAPGGPVLPDHLP